MSFRLRKLRQEQVLFLGFLLLSLVLVAADFFREPVKGFGGYHLMMGSLLGLIVGLISWTLSGGLKGPALVFLSLVFAALTFVAATLNGVHSVTVTMFILLIFMAVPLLGWGAALVTTVGSLVVLWVLAQFAIPVALPPASVQARNLTLIFGGVFLLVWWYSRQLTGVAKDLRQANLLLEQRVEERTKQVVVSEKLATVGRLSATLAHELNSPLGAILSAHSSTESALRGGFVNALRTVSDLPASTRDFVWNLAERLLLEQNPPRLLTPAEQRSKKRQLLQWCEEAGIGPLPGEALSQSLVDFPGLTMEDLTAIGQNRTWKEILLVLETLLTLVRSIEIVGRGASGMTSVVRSFQSLSRRESDTQPTLIDPRAEFESVLILLHGRLPSSVQVIRRFDKEALVFCRADRLGQVLINLVTNALHAMSSRGVLELVARTEGEFTALEVIDSGSGIPAALIEKIFEPFFTTKAPGEGNGLGLDIARRTCEEEGGSLKVTSVPGRTVFTILLPAAQA